MEEGVNNDNARHFGRANGWPCMALAIRELRPGQPSLTLALPALRMNNPRLTQPEEMKTRAYVYGVEKLNGYDAWALLQACALGDLPKVKSLLAKDRRLVNAQHWYQFPIHKAVSAGHTEIVKLLLERGADPGQSRYTYDSWDKLLLCARERGHRQIDHCSSARCESGLTIRRTSMR